MAKDLDAGDSKGVNIGKQFSKPVINFTHDKVTNGTVVAYFGTDDHTGKLKMRSGDGHSRKPSEDEQAINNSLTMSKPWPTYCSRPRTQRPRLYQKMLKQYNDNVDKHNEMVKK